MMGIFVVVSFSNKMLVMLAKSAELTSMAGSESGGAQPLGKRRDSVIEAKFKDLKRRTTVLFFVVILLFLSALQPDLQRHLTYAFPMYLLALGVSGLSTIKLLAASKRVGADGKPTASTNAPSSTSSSAAGGGAGSFRSRSRSDGPAGSAPGGGAGPASPVRTGAGGGLARVRSKSSLG